MWDDDSWWSKLWEPVSWKWLVVNAAMAWAVVFFEGWHGWVAGAAIFMVGTGVLLRFSPESVPLRRDETRDPDRS